MLTLLLAVTIAVATPTFDGTQRAPASPTVVSGSLGPLGPLRRADGQVQAVAVLRPDEDAGGAPVFVVLGDYEQARELDLAPGARVTVRGQPGVVAGRPVLVAASLERARGRVLPVRGGLLAARPPAPPPARRPESTPHVDADGDEVIGYEVRRGVFERLDEVVVAGRRLQRVQLARQVLLLRAPRWALEALRLRAGDRLEVAGRLVALRGRPVIVVDQLRAGDDPPVSCGRRPARAVEQAITLRRPREHRAVDDAVTRRLP